MPYIYEFPRPSVTLDAVVLTVYLGRLEVLLIKRKHPPFPGMHALPGGFLEMDEEPEVGAARELMEETGTSGLNLVPLFACGQTGRDPRGRNITMVYGTLIPKDRISPKGGDDAAEAGWFPLRNPPAMAFDHARMLQEIEAHLFWQASTTLIGKDFLPQEFSLKELTELHRVVLGKVSGASLLARGRRLGLIVPGSTQGSLVWSREKINFPDYAPLVW